MTEPSAGIAADPAERRGERDRIVSPAAGRALDEVIGALGYIIGKRGRALLGGDLGLARQLAASLAHTI